MCVSMHAFFCVCVHRHALLAGRLEGLRTSLDKQTSCLPHLFTSYSHNYTCSPRNHSDNRSTVPQKQKYHIVKRLIGHLLVYFIALSVQICIALLLPLVTIVRGWRGPQSFVFYFCISVMIKTGFIIAQFGSRRQTGVTRSGLISAWFVIFILSGTWHGLRKPL